LYDIAIQRLAFASAYITARIPDKETEPALYAAVMDNQVHYAGHSPTCLRRYKHDGKVSILQRNVSPDVP